MARYKKKNDEEVNWGGRIISFLFLIIFAAGIYFVINLFRSVPVDEISISVQWQLAGNPKWYLTINPDGTASSFDQYTAGDTRNNIEYTYKLDEKDVEDVTTGIQSKLYILTLRDVKTGKEEEIKISKVSRAEMAILRGGKFKNLTKVNIF